jgi:ADP-ribose pyrophosphatase YjhB (NUDIX family)
LIFNENNELLILREAKGPRAAGWGIPTGQADPKQSLAENILRETKEETNLDCEFLEMIGCRELIPYQFNRSDLYFICLLRKLKTSEALKLDGHEISDHKWINYVSILPKFFYLFNQSSKLI